VAGFVNTQRDLVKSPIFQKLFECSLAHSNIQYYLFNEMVLFKKSGAEGPSTPAPWLSLEKASIKTRFVIHQLTKPKF